MFRRWLIFGAIAYGCGACQISTPAHSADPKIQELTRLFIKDKCPITGALGVRTNESALGAAALSTIVPKLVDSGIAATSAALREAAKESVATVVVRDGRPFYSVNALTGDLLGANFGCLIVVRANFTEQPDRSRIVSSFWAEKKRADVLTALKIDGDPEFYFEGRIERSKDQTAFAVVAQMLDYSRHFSSSMFTSKRDLVLTFLFEKPKGKDGDAKAFGFESLNFGTVTPGFRLEGEHAIFRTGYMPMPAIGSRATEALSNAKQYSDRIVTLNQEIAALEKPNQEIVTAKETVFQLSSNESVELKQARLALQRLEAADTAQKGIAQRQAEIGALKKARLSLFNYLSSFEPVNVSVTITETRSAIKWLDAVANVIDAARPAVVSYTDTVLDPTKREAVEAAERQLEDAARNRKKVALDAELANRQAVLLAAQDTALKQALLNEVLANPTSTESQRITAKNNLDLAKFNENSANIRAGFPAPWP